MPLHHLMGVASAVGLLLFASARADDVPAERREDPPALADLEAELEAIQQQTRELSQRLQAVVLDVSRSGDERQQAMLTLGKLGDEDSRRFLVEHLTLRFNRAPSP
jgi:septal ring factor EnvC (AmiA/AmiB activator)